MNIDEKVKLMSDYSYHKVGPVMFEYTNWILHEAQKLGLKKLYFLARDGYLLCEIAKLICSSTKLDIECKYLYCSRYSLRLPSYHLIGDEMYDLLLLNGYYITAESLLMRGELTEDERAEIYSELGIVNADKKLTFQEFSDICAALRESKLYKQLVIAKSKRAYGTTIDYFRQEGLFEDDTLAIVDSGWTGSMQRSIRQLMQSAGFDGKVIGFYFGMYAQPKDAVDGRYLTYYFDSNSNIKRKIMFNNNLFECMLSANHPMTLRYEHNGDITVPVFAGSSNADMLRLVQEQINGALKHTKDKLKTNFVFDARKSQKLCYKLLKKSMVYPTAKEAELYSSFMFCDDVTEGYQLSLADSSMKDCLGDYMLITRVFRKLLGKKKQPSRELYWVHGVIADCPTLTRLWYRTNVVLWDWLKYVIHK